MERFSGPAAFHCPEEVGFETAVSGKGLPAEAETEEGWGSCQVAASVVEEFLRDEKGPRRFCVEKGSSRGSADMVETGG